MRTLYEAMFIVDSAKDKESHAKLEEECLGSITRHGGEIAKCVKWDDRRLTFDIKKVKRGTYFLVHFYADGPELTKIERQNKISDTLLRVLITRDTDGIETATGASALSSAEPGASAPAGIEETAAAKAAPAERI